MSYTYVVESSGLSRQANLYSELDPTFLYQSLSHQILQANPDSSPSQPPTIVFRELEALARQSTLRFLRQQRIPTLSRARLARILQGLPDCDYEYLVFDAVHQFCPYDFTIYCAGQLVKQLRRGGKNLNIVLLHDAEGHYDSVHQVIRQLGGELHIGSWNVNGAAKPEKQLLIDRLCFLSQLDIVCLQEIHHRAQTITTPNYDWILGSSTISRASRGCGFMISKTLKHRRVHYSHHQHHPDVLQLHVLQSGFKTFHLINVHLNSSDYTGRDILQLGGVLQAIPSADPYLVCGDFNLYLGQDIHTNLSYESSRDFVGNILKHPITNARGEHLLGLINHYRLSVLTTIFDRSTETTWSRNGVSSQLDHVLSLKGSRRGFQVQHVKGTWSEVSDHKLLLISILRDVEKAAHLYVPTYVRDKFKRPSWDASQLVGNPKKQELYESALRVKWEMLEAELNSHGTRYFDLTMTQRWDFLTYIACASAKQVLRKERTVSDPNLVAANNELNRQLQLATRRRVLDIEMDYDDSNDLPPMRPPGFLVNLHAARRNVQIVQRDQRLIKFRNMLTAVEQAVKPAEKVNIVCSYMKAHRRVSQLSSPVTLRQWVVEMEKTKGPNVSLMEIPGVTAPLPAYPSIAHMRLLVDQMHNRTSPGLDLVNIEMFKYCSFLFEKLYDLLQEIYLTNEVPEAFTTTVSQPIPKVPSPKEVTDFRRITLSSEGYKIHIKMLGELLLPYLNSLPDYQSGFRRGRSCDDELHMLTSVLTERNNRGLDTYILSMDYRQAFDLVNIHRLPEILQARGVPEVLINRIISSCLTERNCVRWFNDLTPFIDKSLGVKQGCPESPSFFNHILHAAILEVKAAYPTLNIGEPNLDRRPTDPQGYYHDLQFPLLLAYADDTVYLFSELPSIKVFLEAAVPIFASYGLNYNYSKCGLMLRRALPTHQPLSTPLQFEIQDPITHLTTRQEIPFVESLKCLGATLAYDSSRKAIVRPRCFKTMKMFKSMLPHLRDLKLQMPELMRFYHQAITPALTYGYCSSSFTQSMAQSLHNREILMLRDLISCSIRPPPAQTFFTLLQGKTINRKITVYRLRYASHLSRHRDQSLLMRLSLYRPIVRRRVGRPLKTFRQSVQEDKNKYDSPPNYPEIPSAEGKWTEAFKTRGATKIATSTLYLQPLEPGDDDPLDPQMSIYADSNN